MAQHFKVRIADQVTDILLGAGVEIIQADHIVAALERPAPPTSQRLTPVPTSGSMLGMARAVGRPPVPLPVSITPALEVSH